MIAPGVERVDTVKTDSGYEMKSIWSRNDLSDTSIPCPMAHCMSCV